jgi:thioredoxin reductase (NADPH)
MGPELMDNMRAQAEKFGAEFLTDDVTRVELGDKPTEPGAEGLKTVWVGEQQFFARAVILATGSAWRPIGVPGEQELLGHGVSSCATCDGFFFRNQHIIVVGGGDSAMEEATFLTRFAETVTIVHRRDSFRASKVMQKRALDNPKIKIEWNTVVEEILGTDGKVVGARLRDVNSGETKVLDVTGVFVAIGHDPRSELFKGQIELDDEGYVKVDSPSTRTNIAGVFAAGDLVDHTYRQAITASGTGCAAALDAERFIASFVEL